MEKIKIYPLSDKMKDIYDHLMNKETMFLLLHGRVRSGKSFWANYCALRYIKEKVPSPANILVTGRTSGSAKQNALSEWVKVLGVEEFIKKNDVNGEYYIIPLPGYEGKKIYIRGSDTERSKEKIQGQTIDFWYCDERVNHNESFFKMRLTRLSQPHSKAIFTCNPGSPFHFIKQEFLNEEEKGLIDNFKSWSFLMTENPSLLPSYIKGMEQTMKGVDYDRNIKGLWVLSDGLVYDSFNKVKHVLKHSKEMIDKIKKQGTLYIGIDWGTQNATTFLKFAKVGEKFYLLEEYYHSGRSSTNQKSTSVYAQDLKDFIGDDIIKAVYIDPSRARLKVDVLKVGIKKVVNRKNDVLKGIAETHNHLHESNLLIFERCKKTIEELQTYSWDPKSIKNGEDKPLKENDHCMDRLRYTIFTTPKIKMSKGFAY